MEMFKKILLVAASMSIMACSQQNRYSEAPVENDAELMQWVDQMLQDVSAQAFDDAQYLLSGPQVFVYYGEGFPGGSMGWAQNVFALDRFDFIDSRIHLEDLNEARVVFFANEDDGEYGLVTQVGFDQVGAEILGSDLMTDYFYNVSPPVLTEDVILGTRKFEVTLANESTGEELLLISYDLDQNMELKETIQLEVWYRFNGQFERIGKFSTLQARTPTL